MATVPFFESPRHHDGRSARQACDGPLQVRQTPAQAGPNIKRNEYSAISQGGLRRSICCRRAAVAVFAVGATRLRRCRVRARMRSPSRRHIC